VDPGNRMHVRYGQFHGYAVSTGDVDPVYPVLKEVAREQNWPGGVVMKAIFAHVAYYDLGSALTALRSKTFDQMPADLPCATERRGHRMASKLRAHLDHLHRLASANNGLDKWLWEYVLPGRPVESWETISRMVMRVTGNGRWAAYKTTEMIKEVAGWPLEAPDMGHAYSTGPRRGLELLYPELRRVADSNDRVTIALLDRVSANLAAEMRAPLEQCETTLCDFHSLVKGRYYVGHDIDQMQTQLLRAGGGPLINAAGRARARVLPPAYLGEVNGWSGIDLDRCRVFAETGKILLREGA
jgi:hypothetical protein